MQSIRHDHPCLIVKKFTVYNITRHHMIFITFESQGNFKLQVFDCLNIIVKLCSLKCCLQMSMSFSGTLLLQQMVVVPSLRVWNLLSLLSVFLQKDYFLICIFWSHCSQLKDFGSSCVNVCKFIKGVINLFLIFINSYMPYPMDQLNTWSTISEAVLGIKMLRCGKITDQILGIDT